MPEMSEVLLAIRPVRPLGDLPDVPECRGVLDPDIVEKALTATEDPAEEYEERRRARHTMEEVPPPVECASKLWRALKNQSGLTNTARVPQGTEWMLLQSDFRRTTNSVGTNVDPASGVSSYQGEVQIAINPNNPLQLVAGANTFFRDPAAGCQSPTGGASKTFGTQALYGSSDGGATWVYRCAPWPSATTGGVSGATQFFGSDPAVAWDAQGRAVAVYMLISSGSGGDGVSIVAARSTDVGNTWTYLGTIVNNIANPSLFDDKEFVAIDNSPGPPSTLSHPGRIFVIWDQNNVERVAYSDDGATWTTVVLNAPLPAHQYDIGGDVKVGPDGTVYAIWNRLTFNAAETDQTAEITLFSKSVDGGATWSAPLNIATHALFSFGSNNTPPAQDERSINAFGSITLDNNSASAYFGRLYVTYPDFPNGTTSGTNTNVYVVSSSTGGASWSSPLKVNDDAGNATQFFPWGAVDPTDGTLNVTWYDTRIDPTNNRKTQIYYARSIDGGASFEPNILVTDAGASWANHVNYSNENSSDNFADNPNQYGDYSGIVANNRVVIPMWTDTRQFHPVSGNARVEDAAVAAIINCSTPATIPAPTATPHGSCVPADPSIGITVSWNATANWGVNATGGTYKVYRTTTPVLPPGAVPITTTASTSFNDQTGVTGTTYYYFVSATNNCPGTALTPMTFTTGVSAAAVYPGSGATPPTATVSGSANACAGAPTQISAALTGTGPWSVTWSDGVTQSNVLSSPAIHTVSPFVDTTYTVTAVSDVNCSGTFGGSATITVLPTPPVPTVTPGGPTQFCNGESVLLTSSAGSNNQWLLNSNDINGETGTTYTATATGDYSVRVSNGTCAATSAPVTVTITCIRAPNPMSVHPAGGPLAGGTAITIRGTYFQNGATVTLDGAAATSVVVVNSATITAVTPAHAKATVSVTVTNPNGGTRSRAAAFTFTDGVCCSRPVFTTSSLSGASTQPPVSTVTGDFNGDGKPDVASVASDTNTYYAGNGNGTFGTAVPFTAFAGSRSAIATAIWGLGPDDLAVGRSNATTMVYAGATVSPLTGSTIGPLGDSAGIASADFNEDGLLDLAVPDITAQLAISFGRADHTWQGDAFVQIAFTPTTIAAGDFNGDGHVDLAAMGGNGTLKILLGDGTGTFTMLPALTGVMPFGSVLGIAVGDLNGDGKSDLVVSNGAVLLGNGDGTFVKLTGVARGTGKHVAIADLNQDGIADTAIDNTQASVAISIGDGTGAFTPGATIAAPGGTYDAFGIADFDHNGSVDLAIGGAPVIAMDAVTTCSTVTILPASLPSGIAGVVYGGATFTGATTYALTTGTLPTGMNLSGATLSGTPTQSGSFPITITGYNANGCPGTRSYTLVIGVSTPVINAAPVTTTSVSISWPAITGASQYEITRATGTGSPASLITLPGTSYTDNTAAANTVYIYRVRAYSASNAPGSFSNPDIATTVIFTDDPLVAQTTVKAVHITELRNAVNLLRAAAGLSAATFTDPTLTNVAVKAIHIQEIRNALNPTRTPLGLPTMTYTNPTLVGGTSVIKAVDVTEIRNAIR
jgi:hypothetical protein